MENRQYLPSFAELVDMLTIDQIKEVKLPELRENLRKEISELSHDINLIIEERNIHLTIRIVRIIVYLGQVNLQIWENKDKMTIALNFCNEQGYLEYLKKAHQLNGIRNQLKNTLMDEVGDKESSGRKTNFNTDGLVGWDISL